MEITTTHRVFINIIVVYSAVLVVCLNVWGHGCTAVHIFDWLVLYRVNVLSLSTVPV